MGENVTYSAILRSMLDKVPRESDRREGSVIHDMIAPAAMEYARICGKILMFANESFADTASREFLIRRAAERGLSPYPAACAIRLGEFDAEVPIGARFSLNGVNYTVTERVAGGKFLLKCETAGSVGNRDSGGALIPIDYIDGLTSARLTDVIIPGEDEEATEHFRARYFDSFNTQAFGGNVRDYVDKIMAIAGVGGVKIYPAWNGGGTVRAVIIGGDYMPPSKALIDTVQELIDPPPQGAGLGLAPIGHIVTVEGVVPITVDVSFRLTYKNGWNWTAVAPSVTAAVGEYFRELAAEWDGVDRIGDQSASLVVRILRIESRILDTAAGIIDVRDTRLNGVPQNLLLPDDAIPTMGEISDV